jgi:SET domain
MWAHILVVVAVPVGFLPTWFSAIQDRRREMSPAWGLWSLADLSTLLLVIQSGRPHGMDLPYIVVELVCHVMVWLIIGIGSLNPRQSSVLNSTLFTTAARGTEESKPFLVGNNQAGKAVIANRPFPTGEILMEFTGPRYHKSEILVHRSGKDDRFFQIGPDLYMGPSGDIDDLVNHSCDPNAGLKFDDTGIFLVALRSIQRGEEICWDYSTTSSSSTFYMKCMCGTSQCRSVIGDFEFLEPELQEAYRNLKLVPPYLRKELGLVRPTLAA